MRGGRCSNRLPLFTIPRAMKKYIAKTNVSINIVLTSGKNRHISFSALTGGGSVFYTDDPEIIEAMERHYKFGTLFRADTKYNAEKQCNKPTPKPKAEITGQTMPDAQILVSEAEEVAEHEHADVEETDANDEAEDIEEAEDNGLKTIVVSDPDSAKAYLAEYFGYSRTKIKTIKAIKEAAATHGIVFEGI